MLGASARSIASLSMPSPNPPVGGTGHPSADHWMGQGNGDDVSKIYSLQLHYTPGGVPKGLEP